MPTIVLNTSLEDEYQKQLYSLKLRQYYQQRKRQKNLRLLIIISLIFLAIAAFNSFHWAHLVIVIFWWAMFGLSNIMESAAFNRARKRLRHGVEGYYDPSLRGTLSFDSENLSFTVNKPEEETNTLTWDHFIAYNQGNDVLLLATASRDLNVCLTRHEMGDEAFEELRRLASQKLPALKTYFESQKPWWQFWGAKP